MKAVDLLVSVNKETVHFYTKKTSWGDKVEVHIHATYIFSSHINVHTCICVSLYFLSVGILLHICM
jgi:hypothetical protein